MYMNIVIDISSIEQFFSLPPNQIAWAFFVDFGWIIIGITFIIGVIKVYANWIAGQWSKDHKFILLAIDVPKGNEQSPKAVENMFAYLGGAHKTQNFFEKWFIGEYQKSFSYEIVSLGGYTQFIVRTPIEYRDLIESSVYSQYPDAEIMEVDDYMDQFPTSWPNEEYDLWGLEFIQARSWVYPIKTYREFEYQLGPPETHFKDPMASLMDLCGSLGKDEFLGIQIIVTPTGFDWPDESQEEIDKILERQKKYKKGLFMKFLEWLGNLSEIIFSIWGDIEDQEHKYDNDKTILQLDPRGQRRVEAINDKATKLGFLTKIRVLYIAKKDIFNKAKVASGIVGYMKQFAYLDLNNLMPDIRYTLTTSEYFNQKSNLITKKRNIFNAYLSRNKTMGRESKIFNIEELATIWHFPVEAVVKAPLIQKTLGKKAEAPFSLPTSEEKVSIPMDIFSNQLFTDSDENNTNSINEEQDDNTPDNLPIA